MASRVTSTFYLALIYNNNNKNRQLASRATNEQIGGEPALVTGSDNAAANESPGLAKGRARTLADCSFGLGVGANLLLLLNDQVASLSINLLGSGAILLRLTPAGRR